MDLLAIRERLAEQIRDNTGLPVYDLPSGQMTAPSVLMGPPSGRYDQTMGSVVAVTWPLVVVVSRSHPDSLSTLANLISTGGVDDRSIPDALDAASPRPVADWWRVSDWDPWSEIEIGSVSYWSATLNVEIGVS